MVDTRGRNEWLKLIAVVTMLIDHIGLVYYPDELWLRAIGRLAMPIFAYLIAQGYIHSSDTNRYLKRLALFAVISQIPFVLMNDLPWTQGNMLVTFTLSLLWLKLGWKWSPLFIFIGLVVPMDYGFYGLCMAPVFYWLRDRPGFTLGALTLTTLVVSYVYIWPLQIIAIGGVWLALYLPNLEWSWRWRVPRIFWYWFYPGHMLILWAGTMV
jgi:hypothetical protein